MTVSAPFATDLSARNSVTRRTIAKNPAAATVSHIGKVDECHNWSIDDGNAWFMCGVPQDEPDHALRFWR
jgi:hypothetical protein